MDSLLLIYYIFSIVITSCCSSYVSLRQLTNPDIYNRSERPPSENIKGDRVAVTVAVKLRIVEIDVEEVNNEYLFYINLKVYGKWYDNRLTYPTPDPNYKDYNLITGSNTIWYPNLAFLSEITGNEKSGNNWLANVYPNGTVESSARITVAVPAKMRDVSVEGFQLKFISVNYTEKDLKLIWYKENPIELSQYLTWHFNPVAITLDDIYIDTCYSYGLAQMGRHPEGKYSCLFLKAMNRAKALPILLVYLPSSLSVILTWSSFWMEKSNVLGRCLPLFIAIIHLINQKTSVMKSLLVLPHAIRINIWLHICVGLCLAAMVQIASVTYIYASSMIHFRADSSEDTQTILMTREREEDRKSIEEPEGKDGRTHPCERKPFRRYLPSFSRKTAADDLNAISRWLFPLSFVLLLIGFCVLDF